MTEHPSSYRALRFDADAAGAERWADALLEAGALSIDLADPEAGSVHEAPIYGEPGEAFACAWPVTRVSALFAADADPMAAAGLASAAVGQPLPPHTLHEVPEQDWVRATQAQFGPIEITPRLWIVPSWSKAPEPRAVNIVLDPGLAFGTGSHATTRLCLRWLAAHRLHDARVLDYGCGSGVLAIAAARLGARAVTGVDIDPQALIASADNARRNGVSARWLTPGGLAQGLSFDVVLANILANPLIVLAPALAQRVGIGGTIVLSGVLSSQATEVAAVYAQWFRIALHNEEDGWVALEGERLPRP